MEELTYLKGQLPRPPLLRASKAILSQGKIQTTLALISAIYSEVPTKLGIAIINKKTQNE
jgi:hypothetical protein